MHLAKTMRLDISDTKIFPSAAETGEWAITGTFAYVDVDYSCLNSKEKIAYKSGWLGLGSFGRSTLVCVTIIEDFEYQQIIRQLSEYIFSHFEGPSMLEALDAARHEIHDMVSLCNHPTGTLLAIGREVDEIGVTEQVRRTQSSNDQNHARIWEIVPEDILT
jgi:hypothetical protein